MHTVTPPRFQPLGIEQAPEAAKIRLILAEKANGFASNLLGVLAHAPTALEGYQNLSQINQRNSLTPQQREVVQLVAATANGCGFCVAGHTALSLNKFKLDAALVQALRDQAPLPDPQLEQLAQFARQLLLHKGAVDEASLEAFFHAGFSEQHALDVILGLSLATLCNFANSLAQTPLNAPLKKYQWSLQHD